MGSERGCGPAIGPAEELAGASEDTIDAIHELLSSRRRRYVLSRLLEEERVRLGTLSRRVVEYEYDRDPDELPVDVRQRTYLDLYHTHLPKLAEHGIVDYCEEEGTVSLVETDDALESCLEASLADPDSAETV